MAVRAGDPRLDASASPPPGVGRLDLAVEIRPPVPTASTVSALLELAASTGPHRAAVVDPRGTVTYGDLRARACAVAATLAGTGPLLIFATVGVGEISAMLGAAVAGRPYVALDGASPVAVLRQLCARFPGAELLVDAGTAPAAVELGHSGPIVLLGASSDRAEPSPSDPEDLAMVSWTSGTTGRPKGVMHSNRAVVRNALRVRDGLGLRSDDRILATAPVGFVGGATPVYASLAAGSTLCEYVLSAEGGGGLSEFVAESEPTVVFTGPGRARVFAADARRGGRAGSVRLVVVGGDRLLAGHVRELATAFPNARIVQRYNLSETNWVAGCEIVPAALDDTVDLPIGWPVPWLAVDVDGGMATVTGDCLAIGYWDDPGHTERVFSGPSRRRTFRTGDLLVEGPGGLLWFDGRRDRETKVNGVRIDLVEVEQQLVGVAGVTQAAVVVVGGDGDVEHLSAFVVADQTVASGAAVRRAVAASLPAAKLPARIELVTEMPVTARGKVDLDELTAMAARSPAPRADPLRNDTERMVAEVIGRVLQRENVGRDDDLFALGADSLDTEEIATALESVLGRLGAFDLLAHPTPAELAALSESPQETAHLIHAQRGSGRLHPLLLVPGGGGGFAETMAVLGRATGDRDVFVPVPVGYDRRAPADRTIKAMAGSVVADLLPSTGGAPVIVGGYSSGGVVAFETARQLVDRGIPVPVLVLIDSAAPGGSARADRRHERYLQLRQERPGTLGAVIAALWSRFRPRRWWRRQTAGLIVRSGGTQQEVFRSVRGSAIDRYRPRPYDGDVVILCAVGAGPLWDSDSVGEPNENLARWRSYLVREPSFVSLRGTHEEIVLGSGRAATSAVLSDILRGYDDRRSLTVRASSVIGP